MSKLLFILNDPPYGTERSCTACASPEPWPQEGGRGVPHVGDAAAYAKRGQKTPDGTYNLERMLKPVTPTRRGEVGVCGTCMEAHGLTGG